MQRRAVVVGASRGIGAAVVEHLVREAWNVVGVSRTPARAGRWVAADIATQEGVEAVVGEVGNSTVDAFLYMGGTWEADAFSDRYAFERCGPEEIERVLRVNLAAPILLTRALLPALRRSENPKIVFMGAISGLDNYPAREVANSASKFGLRGAVHALRESLRHERIGVTVINPGNVGTPEVLAEQSPDAIARGLVIPLDDLLAVIDCVLRVSRSTCVKEVSLPANGAGGA